MRGGRWCESRGNIRTSIIFKMNFNRRFGMEKIMQFKNNAYLWNGGRRDVVDRESWCII